MVGVDISLFLGGVEVKLIGFLVILQYVSFVDSLCGRLNGRWKNRFHSIVPLKMDGWMGVTHLETQNKIFITAIFLGVNSEKVFWIFVPVYWTVGLWIKCAQPIFLSYVPATRSLGRVYPTYNWALVKLFLKIISESMFTRFVCWNCGRNYRFDKSALRLTIWSSMFFATSLTPRSPPLWYWSSICK